MMFLFAIPMNVDALPVHTAEPVVIVQQVVTPEPVAEALTGYYNGVPIQIDAGVTLTQSDGFTVTMSVVDAVRQEETSVEYAEETEDEYLTRLCLEYAEVKPWLETNCGVN